MSERYYRQEKKGGGGGTVTKHAQSSLGVLSEIGQTPVIATSVSVSQADQCCRVVRKMKSFPALRVPSIS